MAKHKRKQRDRYHWRFRIGESVTVIDPGYSYCHHREMAAKMKISENWAEGPRLSTGSIVNIVAREFHPDTKSEIYAVYSPLINPTMYIMDPIGLKRVEDTKR